MSGLKKIFVIFVVAIVLAAACNVFMGGANATDDSITNTTATVDNTNVNTNTENNVAVDNTNTNTNTDNTNTNANTNTNTDDNTNTNANTNTNTNNTVDLSQVQNTLPKTGSNYRLKNVFLSIFCIAVVALGVVFIYNKKVGMTDETKR